MTVGLRQENKGCSSEDLRGLAAAVGQSLPEDFAAFLLKHDGARPEPNVFKVAENNSSGVNKFLSCAQIREDKAVLGEGLVAGAWPVADAEGGNLVCLKLNAGRWSVVFWDHEVEEYAFLAESFTEFLDSLQKFDPQSVELKPGQVKRVWINPDFLKRNQ